MPSKDGGEFHGSLLGQKIVFSRERQRDHVTYTRNRVAARISVETSSSRIYRALIVLS
jgi:hypothetical protein